MAKNKSKSSGLARQSRIFSAREFEALQHRFNGDYSDPDGTFARAKPKILEIINFWSRQDIKRKLKKAADGVRRSKSYEEDYSSIDNSKGDEDMTMEEYKKKTGWGARR